MHMWLEHTEEPRNLGANAATEADVSPAVIVIIVTKKLINIEQGF